MLTHSIAWKPFEVLFFEERPSTHRSYPSHTAETTTMKRLTIAAIAFLTLLVISVETVDAKGFLRRLPLLRRVGSYRQSLELKQQVASQSHEISDLTGTVAELGDSVTERDAEIAEQASQILTQQHSLDDLNSSVTSKDAKIAQQQQSIAELTKQLASARE
ncbi:MAG: hypothetical protein ISQ07_15080, partial [Pirellulales bacterium]|nr:hypothetical protein [Pirellulales bacterium]